MARFPFSWGSPPSSATISPTKTTTHQTRYRQRQITHFEPDRKAYRYSHLNATESRQKLYTTSYRNLNYRPRRTMPTGSYPCTATTTAPTTEQGLFAWAYAAVDSVVNGPSTTTLIGRQMENQNPNLSPKISSRQTREEYIRQLYGYTGERVYLSRSHEDSTQDVPCKAAQSKYKEKMGLPVAGQQPPQGPLTFKMLGDGWEFGKLELRTHVTEIDRVDFKPVYADWETVYGGSKKVGARASWKTGEVPGLAQPAKAIVHDEHKSAAVMRVGSMSDEENERAPGPAEEEVWEDDVPEEEPVILSLANTSAEKAKEIIESPSQRYYGAPELGIEIFGDRMIDRYPAWISQPSTPTVKPYVTSSSSSFGCLNPRTPTFSMSSASTTSTAPTQHSPSIERAFEDRVWKEERRDLSKSLSGTKSNESSEKKRGKRKAVKNFVKKVLHT